MVSFNTPRDNGFEDDDLVNACLAEACFVDEVGGVIIPTDHLEPLLYFCEKYNVEPVDIRTTPKKGSQEQEPLYVFSGNFGECTIDEIRRSLKE
jgi:hypothetical protein